MTEFLCCSLETTTTLLIRYTPRQNKFLSLKKNNNILPGAGNLVYWDQELFEACDGSTSTGCKSRAMYQETATMKKIITKQNMSLYIKLCF